jgi:hypothetical protein
MCMKLSLFLVYRELFSKAMEPLIRYSRAANYATAFLVFTYYTAAFLVSIFQCTPVAKAWNTQLNGTCVNMTAFRYSTAVVNIVTSLLVIGIPLPTLFQVKHRSSELTQFTILILLGLI